MWQKTDSLLLDHPPYWSQLPRPKVLVLFTSFRCDARCAMCSTWVKQKTEPSIDHRLICRLFEDSLLRSSLEILNLTGGEPTLNDDLVANVAVAIDRCRRLRRVDMPTNGMNTDRVVDQIEQLAALLAGREVHLGITLSVDGIGAAHEKVRGRPGVFPSIEKTLAEIQDLTKVYGFLSLSLNMTVGNLNINELYRVRQYAKQKGLPINYTPAAISEVGVESAKMDPHFLPDPDQRERFAEFIEILMESREIDPVYGRFATSWLRTNQRTLDCSFRQGRNCLLEPDGNLYLCGNYKDFKLGNVWESSFSQVWKNIGSIPPDAWKKCAQCESNCYLNP